MTEYKPKRPYTVSSVNDKNYNSKPALRISGDWLADLGFEIGKKVNIICEAGKLTVTLADEILQE